MRFKNRIVLVTGGGTGIGKATSLLFASAGADVVVNYSRSKCEAEETVAEIQSMGRKAVAIAADVSDETEVLAMFSQVADELGRLDVLVNNAATTSFVPYTDLDGLTSDAWDRIFDVNVKGAFFCSRAAIPLLRKGRTGIGQIINVSSIAGITGTGSSIAYAASKAALINMTRAFAVSQGPDIRVNAVAPGVVLTRWVDGKEEFIEPHRKQTPLQRVAEPHDVAMAIYGIAINDFVTGQTLVVDGGRTLC